MKQPHSLFTAPRNHHKRRPLPQLPHHIRQNDNRERQVGLKETGRRGGYPDRPDGNVELRYKDHPVKDQAPPRADHAERRFEGQFFQGVALGFPGGPETDMGPANGAPSENGGEPEMARSQLKTTSEDSVPLM